MSESLPNSLAVPFPQSWWIDPGRVLGGCYPGDLSPAERDRRLAGLLACGVRTVVNLQRADEPGASGKPFEDYVPRLTELAAERGVEVRAIRCPIADMGVPDEATMRKALAEVRCGLERGVAYVHCWGGHGRTGTVGGCWLVEQGRSAEEAFAQMAEARLHHPRRHQYPRVPQTTRQESFVRAWSGPT